VVGEGTKILTHGTERVGGRTKVFARVEFQRSDDRDNWLNSKSHHSGKKK